MYRLAIQGDDERGPRPPVQEASGGGEVLDDDHRPEEHLEHRPQAGVVGDEVRADADLPGLGSQAQGAAGADGVERQERGPAGPLALQVGDRRGGVVPRLGDHVLEPGAEGRLDGLLEATGHLHEVHDRPEEPAEAGAHRGAHAGVVAGHLLAQAAEELLARGEAVPLALEPGDALLGDAQRLAGGADLLLRRGQGGEALLARPRHLRRPGVERLAVLAEVGQPLGEPLLGLGEIVAFGEEAVVALAELLQARALGGEGAHEARQARLRRVRLALHLPARRVHGGERRPRLGEVGPGRVARGPLAGQLLLGVDDLLLEHLAPRGEGLCLGGEGGALLGVHRPAVAEHRRLAAEGLRLVAQGGLPGGEVGDARLLRPALGVAGLEARGELGRTPALHLEAGGLDVQGVLGERQGALAAVPLVAVPDALQLLEVAAEEVVLFRALRLAAEGAGAGLHLAEDVADALEVALRLLDALQGLLALAQVRRDAGGLLKERPARLGPQGERRVHQPLADHRVAAARQARPAEDVEDVAVADLVAVQDVLVLAGAVGAPADEHLRVFEGQDPLRVVQGDEHLGHAHPRAGARAGKDHVLGGLGPQGGVGLLAHHPADGVGDVGLARAVRTDDGGDPLAELEYGAGGKALESTEFEAFQAHGFTGGGLVAWRLGRRRARRALPRRDRRRARPARRRRPPARRPAWWCPRPGPTPRRRRSPGR